MLVSPQLGFLLPLLAVSDHLLPDVRDQGVVRIRVCQEACDAKDCPLDGQRRRPHALGGVQYLQANLGCRRARSRSLDVRVVNRCQEVHLRRHHRVVIRDLDAQSECPPWEGRVLWAFNQCVPFEGVVLWALVRPQVQDQWDLLALLQVFEFLLSIKSKGYLW